MLREFSCANYLSFDEEQRLSFATASPRPYVSVESPWGDGLGTVLVGLGPNASGKTNMLKALAFLGDFIHKTQQLNNEAPIPVSPCAFVEKDRPSEFTLEVEEPESGRRYRYEVALTHKEVLSEYLYRRERPKGRWVRLLARERDKMEACGYVFDLHKSLRMRRDLFASTLRANVSFFHVFHLLPGAMLQDFFHLTSFWDNFAENEGWQRGLLSEAQRQTMLKGLYEADFIQKWISGILSQLDIGIQSFSIVRGELKQNSSVKDFMKRLRDLTKTEAWIAEESPVPEDTQEFYHYDALFEHRHGEDSFTLPLERQSSGTRELLFLVDRVLWTLAHGYILIHDELECGLHPLVLPDLVELFANPEFNCNKAQLICTCHAPDLLRRLEKEQIFLVEKDERGASRISRLDDFKGVRRDDNYAAKYLAGSYGALPQIQGPLLPLKEWQRLCEFGHILMKKTAPEIAHDQP